MTTGRQPSHHEIATCAYYLWQQRGQHHGRDVDIWLEAEGILRTRASEASESEQRRFDVVLTDAGNDEIRLVRQIRAITGLELRRVKALFDNTPQTIAQDLDRQDADALVHAIEQAGGTAEVAARRR
jgi:ribosomal protein L7/L12